MEMLAVAQLGHSSPCTSDKAAPPVKPKRDVVAQTLQQTLAHKALKVSLALSH